MTSGNVISLVRGRLGGVDAVIDASDPLHGAEKFITHNDAVLKGLCGKGYVMYIDDIDYEPVESDEGETIHYFYLPAVCRGEEFVVVIELSESPEHRYLARVVDVRPLDTPSFTWY
jgi:hypothetical protein